MATATLLLDANLLVLLVVGLHGPASIGRHKRLQGFTPKDYDVLETAIGLADDVLLTPNTLTEASNLVRQTTEPLRSAAMLSLQHLIEHLPEVEMSGRDAARHRAFVRLGMTDAVLLTLLERQPGRTTLLTTDADLFVAALDAGADALLWDYMPHRLR